MKRVSNEYPAIVLAKIEVCSRCRLAPADCGCPSERLCAVCWLPTVACYCDQVEAFALAVAIADMEAAMERAWEAIGKEAADEIEIDMEEVTLCA